MSPASGVTPWIAPGKHHEVALPGKAGQRLQIFFEVLQGYDVDFRLVLEKTSGDVISLYGPARRARSLSSAVRVPSDGTLHAVWDNSGSWFRHKQVNYEMEWLDNEPEKAEKRQQVVSPPSTQKTDKSETFSDLLIATGTKEEVAVPVTAGATLGLKFDVCDGRDIDFSVVLDPADESGPFRLYGPARRQTRLRAEVECPKTGTAYVGFDATGAWFRSRTVRYSCDCQRDEVC